MFNVVKLFVNFRVSRGSFILEVGVGFIIYLFSEYLWVCVMCFVLCWVWKILWWVSYIEDFVFYFEGSGKLWKGFRLGSKFFIFVF